MKHFFFRLLTLIALCVYLPTQAASMTDTYSAKGNSQGYKDGELFPGSSYVEADNQSGIVISSNQINFVKSGANFYLQLRKSGSDKSYFYNAEANNTLSLRNVTITETPAQAMNANAVLTVYGLETPWSASASKTELGRVTKANPSLDVTGDYHYIYIESTGANAMAMGSIALTWDDSEASGGTTPVDPVDPDQPDEPVINPDGQVFRLVTADDQLVAGAQYVIYTDIKYSSVQHPFIASNIIDGNNLKGIETDESIWHYDPQAATITILQGSTVGIMTLEAGPNGTFAMKINGKYVQGGVSNQNIKLEDTPYYATFTHKDGDKWAISYAAVDGGQASWFKANYTSAGAFFRNYGSENSCTNPQLFRLDSASEPVNPATEPTMSLQPGEVTSGTVVTFTAPEGCLVSVSDGVITYDDSDKVDVTLRFNDNLDQITLTAYAYPTGHKDDASLQSASISGTFTWASAPMPTIMVDNEPAVIEDDIFYAYSDSQVTISVPDGFEMIVAIDPDIFTTDNPFTYTPRDLDIIEIIVNGTEKGAYRQVDCTYMVGVYEDTPVRYHNPNNWTDVNATVDGTEVATSMEPNGLWLFSVPARKAIEDRDLDIVLTDGNSSDSETYAFNFTPGAPMLLTRDENGNNVLDWAEPADDIIISLTIDRPVQRTIYALVWDATAPFAANTSVEELELYESTTQDNTWDILIPQEHVYSRLAIVAKIENKGQGVAAADRNAYINALSAYTMDNPHLLTNTADMNINGEVVLTGIDTIDADSDDASVRWFNLQGVSITEPTQPGIYIRKSSNGIEKVFTR